MSLALLASADVHWRELTDPDLVEALIDAGARRFFAEHLVLLRDHPPVATEITRRLAAP